MPSQHVLFFLFVGLVLPGCFRGGQDQSPVSVTNSNGVMRITVNGQTVELKETEKDIVRQAFATGTAPRMVVEVFAGKITIESGADDAVEAEVTRTALGETLEDAKANLQLVDVQMKQENETIHITARRAAEEEKNAQKIEALKKQYAVRGADAVVKVPANAALVLKTAFGDIEVKKIAGRVEAETSSGAVSVTGGKGELNLTSHFGSLTVDGPNTAVTASTKSGTVSVMGAKGPLDLSSGFGPVTVEGAVDKVSAKTNSGNVTVNGAKGAVNLTSGFGTLNVDGATRVQAETNSGDVTVKRAVGMVSAKTGFGKIVVEQAPAGANLESNSGDIRLRAGNGAVELTSGFGTIDADVSGATVRATSRSGAVNVRGALADGEHALHSNFGKVTLTLPGDSRFRLDAATKFGAVKTAFVLTRTDEKSNQRLRGVVGDEPKVVLKLTADSGDVEVRKD